MLTVILIPLFTCFVQDEHDCIYCGIEIPFSVNPYFTMSGIPVLIDHVIRLFRYFRTIFLGIVCNLCSAMQNVTFLEETQIQESLRRIDKMFSSERAEVSLLYADFLEPVGKDEGESSAQRACMLVKEFMANS